MFVSEQDRAVNFILTGCNTYLRNSKEYELWGHIKSNQMSRWMLKFQMDWRVILQ